MQNQAEMIAVARLILRHRADEDSAASSVSIGGNDAQNFL